MTKSQTAKYWREWSKVRRVLIEMGGFSCADADQERHEIHCRALGQDKSSKDLNNRDLDAIFDHFESYLVITNGPSTGPSRADSQPVKRLVWAITKLGLPDPYIAAIAHTDDWRNLDATSLHNLRFTLVKRAAARRRRAVAGNSD